jgi:hypothetical protein
MGLSSKNRDGAVDEAGQKDSAGVMAYLKKEIEKESQGKMIDSKQATKSTLCASKNDGLIM